MQSKARNTEAGREIPASNERPSDGNAATVADSPAVGMDLARLAWGDSEPRPACGAPGVCTMARERVTCQACLEQLVARRRGEGRAGSPKPSESIDLRASGAKSSESMDLGESKVDQVERLTSVQSRPSRATYTAPTPTFIAPPTGSGRLGTVPKAEDPEPRPKRSTGQSPQRPIRIPDEEWYGAVAKAKEQGLNISQVTRRLLRAWRDGDIELPS